MILRITRFFISRPRAANLVLILIILAGVATAMTIRRQGYPPVNMDIVKITTEYPGAGPKDVEVNVTEPIEEELQEVEDVEKIESISMENFSIVLVYVDPDASEAARVRMDIRNAVDRVTDLPKQVKKKPGMEEIRSTNAPIIEIALSGDVPEKTLRKYAKSLETKLKAARGLGRIEKIGYRKREIHINADPKALNDIYVSLGEIMESIQARNVREPGGTLESYPAQKEIVTFSEYGDPLEVANDIIRSSFAGPQLSINQVAEVVEGFEDYSIIPRANGKRCVSLIIRSQENADVITLSENVESIVNEFKKHLPAGVTITLVNDMSDYVKSLLRIVRNNGLIGFAFVFLLLMLFLDIRTSFWTALGIPISICGAFVLFPLFGITINYLSLMAMVLVLGILVDDAIVFAESIYRHKEMGMADEEAAIAGVKQVLLPVAASVLTTMFAFAPMLFMTGMIGKFVISIPIVVILMLGFSLMESVFFLPAHIVHCCVEVKETVRKRWMEAFRSWYRKVLTWCLAHRIKVFIVYGIFAVSIVVASSFWLKFILMEYEDPDIFHVVAEAPFGTPLEQTAELAGDLEDVVHEVIPDDLIKSVSTRIGNHDTDIYGITRGNYEHYILLTVYLKMAEDRDEKAEPFLEAIGEKLKTLKGFGKAYVTPFDDGPPVGKPVTVIYTTTDDELRDRFERDTIDFLKSIEGIYGIESDNIKGKDELRLIVDQKMMARLGLTARDVARTVRAAFDGEVVTSIRRDGEEIDFRVQLKGGKQFLVDDILNLRIGNDEGHLVPLNSFARFEETAGPAVISHHNSQRSVTITAEVDTKIVTSGEANEMVRDHFAPLAAKNAGFIMELGGEEKKTAESMNSLYLALAVALVAIYFLLVLAFDSFGQPFLIMAVIPFAIIGVFLTFMLHGLPLSFIAMIGIVGLVGVVVNDSIVMVSTLNHQRVGSEELTGGMIIEAAVSRLRPVVLTTMTTCAGLLPTAYGIGGDLPFLRPMVLAVAWGLVFSTVVTLLLIPLVYSVVMRMEKV